mgnify:CR=1 FL=1
MEDNYAISLHAVEKKFGSTVVFEDVNLDVPAGGSVR